MQNLQSSHGIYFFGEEYRFYFGLIHIVIGFKAILGFDLGKLLFETVILASAWGYFGVISLIHVSIGLFFLLLAALAVKRERYILIIPLVILKIAELSIYFIIIISLSICLFLGTIGKKYLKKVLHWRLRKLEYFDLNTFPLLLILMFVIFIVANIHTLIVSIKVINYYKQKAMSEYLYKRRKVLASFV